MQAATPPSEVSRVPAQTGRVHTGRTRCSPDCRQLRNSQTLKGVHMAAAAAPIRDSLHAYLLLLAQSGRTLVCPDSATRDPPRFVSQCEGTRGENRRLRPAVQLLASAVRMDCNRRLYSRQHHQTLFTYFRDSTLADRNAVGMVT